MKEINFNIIKSIGTISSNNGWTKELNVISWNGKERKFDLRSWDENHEKMSKGVTMTQKELMNLKELLNSIDISTIFGTEMSDDIEEDLLDEM